MRPTTSECESNQGLNGHHRASALAGADAAPFLLHDVATPSSADVCDLYDLKMQHRRAKRAGRRTAPP